MWIKLTKLNQILKLNPTKIELKKREITLAGTAGVVSFFYEVQADAAADYKHLWSGIQVDRQYIDMKCVRIN